MIKTDTKKRYAGRLEDFIRLAEKGKQVELDVELKTIPVTQEVSVDDKKITHKQHKTYVLIAYFTCRADNEIQRLSKVYMFATGEESLNSIRVNKEIANARLQVDYNRLKAAHIHFTEEFF